MQNNTSSFVGYLRGMTWVIFSGGIAGAVGCWSIWVIGLN